MSLPILCESKHLKTKYTTRYYFCIYESVLSNFTINETLTLGLKLVLTNLRLCVFIYCVYTLFYHYVIITVQVYSTTENFTLDIKIYKDVLPFLLPPRWSHYTLILTNYRRVLTFFSESPHTTP